MEDCEKLDWLGQMFKVEDTTYRLFYFKWENSYGDIYPDNNLVYFDRKPMDEVWIGATVSGEILLKALGREETEYADRGYDTRIINVIQRIEVLKDGEFVPITPVSEPFDPEKEIDIDTSKKMMIYNVNMEYYLDVIFRNFSGLREYTYGEGKWTEYIKGRMKIKDILEKMGINLYHKYDGGMVCGPMIDYPIALYFK